MYYFNTNNCIVLIQSYEENWKSLGLTTYLIIPLQQQKYDKSMKGLTHILFCLSFVTANAQRPWTANQCMQYAVTHNHEVRLQHITLDNYQTEKLRQTAAFLPTAETNIGGQYNFGRAIDPETNTYTNVSTFYNSYNISVSIPIFDGFQRYNNLRAAKADVLMGKSQLLALKDATAQKVLQTYLQLLYYKGCIDIAIQKRAESEMLLKQTQLMVEVGQKGEGDVAQIQATFAADDYEVTHQQGLYDQTLLTMKQQMNYPINEPLEITAYDETPQDAVFVNQSEILAEAKRNNPDIKQAKYGLKSAQYAYRSSKGALFPTLSIGVGASTTYYKQQNLPHTSSFGKQFRNNAGEFVYATLSIPLFNRLNTLTNMRRQRNNVKRAEEELAYRNNELQRLIQETIVDQESSRKETKKMQAKVEADSIAAQLTIHKYKEGLATSIDVQTQSVTLLQSKAQLLQCQLTYIYKTRILNFYKGAPLWTE